MDILARIHELNYWWAIVLLFCIVSGIGFLIGLGNGWKTATYFLSWNLIGTLVTVLVVDNIFDSIIQNHIQNAIRQFFSGDKLPVANKQISYLISFLKDFIILLAVFGVYLLTSLLGLIIYFFIRKYLKRSLKDAKAHGKSNFLSRSIGGTIGFVNTIPFVCALAGPATFFSRSDGVNKIVSGLTKASTFGVVNDISQNTNDIYVLTNSYEVALEFAQILQNNSEDMSEANKQNLRKNAPKLAKVFNSANLSNLIGNLIKDGFAQEKKVDFNKELDSILDSIKQILEDPKTKERTTLDLNQEGVENLKNLLRKIGKENSDKAIKTIIDALVK